MSGARGLVLQETADHVPSRDLLMDGVRYYVLFVESQCGRPGACLVQRPGEAAGRVRYA